jgi:cell division septal protein FtsQ
VTVLRRAGRPAVLVATAVLLAAGALALTRTGLFHVREIRVEGISRLSEREVIRRAGLSGRDNAVWLDTARAEQRLTSDPWVASADVHVDLPWTVTVTVTERSPVGIVDRGGSMMLVAADGTILGSPARRSTLPTIVAPPAWVGKADEVGIGQVAAALGAMDGDLRSLVDRVTLGPSGIELALRDGVRVVYGTAADAAEKARAIQEVLDWAQTSGRRVRLVNVTAPGAPAVAPAT